MLDDLVVRVFGVPLCHQLVRGFADAFPVVDGAFKDAALVESGRHFPAQARAHAEFALQADFGQEGRHALQFYALAVAGEKDQRIQDFAQGVADVAAVEPGAVSDVTGELLILHGSSELDFGTVGAYSSDFVRHDGLRFFKR